MPSADASGLPRRTWREEGVIRGRMRSFAAARVAARSTVAELASGGPVLLPYRVSKYDGQPDNLTDRRASPAGIRPMGRVGWREIAAELTATGSASARRNAALAKPVAPAARGFDCAACAFGTPIASYRGHPESCWLLALSSFLANGGCAGGPMVASSNFFCASGSAEARASKSTF